MTTPGRHGKPGLALALLAIAVALLLIVSGVAAYYLVVSPNGARNGSSSESYTSASCLGSASPSCVATVSNTTLAVVSDGPLVLGGVKVISICYVSNCGTLPMFEVIFSLANLSAVNGTIVSLNVTCDGCGIGDRSNHEGYSLAALIGGYGNESAYKCQTGTSELDNVPPGNTSYDVVCDGPGSALIINPYYFRIAVCIPGNVSSGGACDQGTTDLAVSVNAAQYGSHLLPARHWDTVRPLGLTGMVARFPPAGRLFRPASLSSL